MRNSSSTNTPDRRSAHSASSAALSVCSLAALLILLVLAKFHAPRPWIAVAFLPLPLSAIGLSIGRLLRSRSGKPRSRKTECPNCRATFTLHDQSGVCPSCGAAVSRELFDTPTA